MLWWLYKTFVKNYLTLLIAIYLRFKNTRKVTLSKTSSETQYDSSYFKLVYDIDWFPTKVSTISTITRF